jgi:hypothetical protein
VVLLLTAKKLRGTGPQYKRVTTPSLLTTQMMCLSIKRNKEIMMPIVVCEYINLGGVGLKAQLLQLYLTK